MQGDRAIFKHLFKRYNLYRISSYAKLRGVDRETVRYWVKKDKVRSIKFDNTVFIVIKKE